MKLVGLILAGLCIGCVSSINILNPFERQYEPQIFIDMYCEQIEEYYAFGKEMNYAFHVPADIFQLCKIPTDASENKGVMKEGATTSDTKLESTSVASEVSSEKKLQKVSDTFRTKEKMVKDANSETPDEFSIKTSPSTSDGTNSNIPDDFSSIEVSNVTEKITEVTSSKTSNDASTEIAPSENTERSTDITSPKVLVASSSSHATEKSTEVMSTKTPEDSSAELSKITDSSTKITNPTSTDDESSEITNSPFTDADISDIYTTGTTSKVSSSIVPDNKDLKGTTKEIERTSKVDDSSLTPTPVTIASESTSLATTLVTDLLETSSATDEVSETSKSIISVSSSTIETTSEKQTTSDASHSTSFKSTAFMSTDYSTSEKTSSDAESSTSYIQPEVISTTRLFSTERATTDVNTSSQSPETTTDVIETTHTITTIEFPATRTLKLAVSITFLVIALLALLSLVGYFIVSRRKTFSYDELMLLP